MSKKKINTRDLIINKALEMFNERGIEYVGLRELAGLLDIRVSNITYYFPTKDDLVNQLALDLNKLNSELMVDENDLTMQSFLKMMQGVFRNQFKYRSILLSIVHVMKQNKVISERHKQTQKDRNKVLEENLNTLAANGFLRFAEEGEAALLASTISLIARFWISESAISFRQLDPEAHIKYYLSMIARLLSPYTTVEAKNQIRALFEN